MRKTILSTLILLLATLLAGSCSWDLNPQPTVTVTKTDDIHNGKGTIELHFNPPIQQDIILKTSVTYESIGTHIYQRQIEVPAWAPKATVNFDVAYDPRRDIGMEITFKLVKAYGDCMIGNPSEVTLKIIE